jgi:hypothetical protein
MSNVKLFEDRKIRSIWIEEKERWFFSVIDVLTVITESNNPRRYWSDLKRKLKKEGLDQLYEIIVQLKLESEDGKKYNTDCSDAKGLLRIIQSIPSPKAEPFKRWLAQVGYERLEEIDDPELASKRAREIYKAKGYPEEWIEKRMRSMAIREELTDEWDKRGVKEAREYAILTAEISKAAFGLTPSQYKETKNLQKENLRDHMTDLELIFSMLGEASATEITRTNDAKGFDENKGAAVRGGKVAGDARQALEKETGQQVISSENYLPEQKKLFGEPTENDEPLNNI